MPSFLITGRGRKNQTIMNETKDNYNQLYSDNEITFGGGKAEYIVRDVLKYKKEGSVLEIGAGEGRNSLFLAAQGFDVEAIDISDKGIGKLQKTAEKQGLKIKTEVIDIRSSFPDKNYDIIASTFVLHHLLRQEGLAVIGQIKDQTNPGGINVIASFTKEGDFYNDNPNTDKFYLDIGELKELYKDWEVLEYSEERGIAFQKKDDGSPMFNVSAKLLARKPPTNS